MTRKDYKRIADGFYYAKPANDAERDVWARTLSSVANQLRNDNPRFDYDKFLAACHGTDR